MTRVLRTRDDREKAVDTLDERPDKPGIDDA